MLKILYLCATPIGNLEDITMRCIKILSESDIIAAEDTRHSLKLLNYFNIKPKKLISYHEHNKHEQGKFIISELKLGKTVALITDAGMPAISDPGEELVALCHSENIGVSVIPGACAAISALAVSGLNTKQFIFLGFLSTNNKERRQCLLELIDEKRTVILYEAPHHLKKTLEDILNILGDRVVCIARELTKRFEEITVMPISEALLNIDTPKGEYVIVIQGVIKDCEPICNDVIQIIKQVDSFISMGFNKMDAMKATAKACGVSKSVVYKAYNDNENIKD